MREQLKALYLEWVNHYLTPDKMAEHKVIEVEHLKALISIGKHYHEIDVAFYKEFGYLPPY